MVYIDDATSRLMQLYFTYAESTSSYFERYGKPQAFYSDKASLCQVTPRRKGESPGLTQFGRCFMTL